MALAKTKRKTFSGRPGYTMRGFAGVASDGTIIVFPKGETLTTWLVNGASELVACGKYVEVRRLPRPKRKAGPR